MPVVTATPQAERLASAANEDGKFRIGTETAAIGVFLLSQIVGAAFRDSLSSRVEPLPTDTALDMRISSLLRRKTSTEDIANQLDVTPANIEAVRTARRGALQDAYAANGIAGAVVMGATAVVFFVNRRRHEDDRRHLLDAAAPGAGDDPPPDG